MPLIELNQATGTTIKVMGTDATDHPGEYFVRIKSCITVFDQGLPLICPRCCTDSDPFQVTLFNACESSVI